MKTKKGQALSTDVIIVVVVILFATLFFIVYKIQGVDNVNIEESYDLASQKSEIIVKSLESEGVLDEENQVDVGKLLQLSQEELREEYGISGEFAIVFEKDGNLVKLDPDNNVYCVGSNSFEVNGIKCR